MNSNVIVEIGLLALLAVSTVCAAELRHEIYDPAAMSSGKGPRFVRHSPNNEANPRVKISWGQ